MTNSIREQQQTQLIYWSLWYFLLTTIVVWLIGMRYLTTIIPLQLPYLYGSGHALVYSFLFISYFSHMALLTYLVWLLMVFPVIYVIPKPIFVLPVAIFSATLLTFFIVLDSHVYQLYRFHLNSVLLHLVFGGEARDVFGLNVGEWTTGFMCILAILLVQMGLCYVSRIRFERWHHGRRMVITLLGLLCLSYYCAIMSAAHGRYELIQQTIALPYYKDVLRNLVPMQRIFSNVEKIAQAKYSQPRQISAKLHYPLKPLQCTPIEKPFNVVLLVIDTWRFKALQDNIMPNLKALSKQSWYFTEHLSGGNSTQAGMFSLFYSLPNSYWTAMIEQNKGPLLIKTMLDNHYQMAIHWSGQLTIPAFDKTLFHDIPFLEKRTPYETPIQNDRYITEKALHFLEHRDPKRPFFLFSMYLAAHSYCESDVFPTPRQPSIKKCHRLFIDNTTDPLPYLNRYYNAVTAVDEQIGRILNALKKEKLYDNTVVIITGDHGEEFNDNHNNYWFHTSNFTDFQIKTPLLILWPHATAKQWTHVTSHYDLAPTLLKRVLNCKNSASDYGLGRDLFSPHPKNYFLASSYVNFGIISEKGITVLSPQGEFLVQDKQANPITGAAPDVALIKAALEDMRKFF